MATTTNIPSFTGADFATRMEVLKQLADVTGIRLPQTIVPEGESLIPYGEQRKRELKEQIYALPTIEEAFQRVRDIRMEQDPRDIKVPLQRVRMRADGAGLYGKGAEDQPALAYTATAFGQVAQVIKPASVVSGFHQTLLALPPAIRADAFNHFAERSTEGKQYVLRTLRAPARVGGDLKLRRSINAVVSERYTVVEDHTLIQMVQAALPAGARVRYTYDENRTDLEIIWPALNRQLKVGDIATIVIHISNSQTKQGAIDIVAKLLRILCLNFTTAYTEGGDCSISIRHIGEAAVKFAAAIRNALAIIEPFVLAFGDAYQSEFPTFAPTRGEVISRFVKKFELSEKIGGLIASAWDADGTMSAGNTLAGLANAATRVSQQFGFDKAEPLEAAAGRVVRNGWGDLS